MKLITGDGKGETTSGRGSWHQEREACCGGLFAPAESAIVIVSALEWPNLDRHWPVSFPMEASLACRFQWKRQVAVWQLAGVDGLDYFKYWSPLLGFLLFSPSHHSQHFERGSCLPAMFHHLLGINL